MARGLPALLLLLLLALPAGAAAASKTVKLPVPADGDVSFAQYRVLTAAPGEARIRNARRIGGTQVSVFGRRVRGRRYEVTVVALNPRGGARAAQTDTAISILLLTSKPAPIGAAKTGAADNVLTQAPTPKESAGIRRFCSGRLPAARRRGRFFAGSHRSRTRVRGQFVPFACLNETPEKTVAARAGLEAAGVAVPGCVGTTQRYQDSSTEMLIRAICSSPTPLVNIQAQKGNTGANCLGPPGSTCACGPFCAPLPAESGCFNDNDNFAINTPLEFRVAYQQPVDPRDVTSIWVPQGSPVTDSRHTYLRALP
jgi:hypothetical protein